LQSWYYNDMSTVSVQELQRDTAGWLDRVELGEKVVVLRGDRPVAELRPIAQIQAGPRPYGLAAREFTVPADFDDPLPDSILREFEAG
jgi:antitoxin (DNA-binding transcriptional repressor) of toxin-antitoxin stability system